ncbi:glycosyltransferase [Nitriliruptoraceae bacterium ZYF776]|nr:glycosyltransferase [Profundirhabdus halotolerans]
MSADHRTTDDIAASLAAAEASPAGVAEAPGTSVAQLSERRRLTDHLLHVQAELNALARQHDRLIRQRERAETRHSRKVAGLEDSLAMTRYERDLARWQAEVVQQRRWLRIGRALGVLRRQPWMLPIVLARVARIALGAPGRPRRPAPNPPEATAEIADDASVAVPLDVAAGVHDTPPTPARTLVAATALRDDAELHLSYEWVSEPITARTWQTVLDDGTPDLLVVDQTGLDRLARKLDRPWQEVIGAFAGSGVRTVFWETRRLGSNVVDRDVAASFDAIACSFPDTVDAVRSATAHPSVLQFAPAAQTRLVRPAPTVRKGDVLGLSTLAAPRGESPLVRAARRADDAFVIDGEPAGADEDLPGTTATRASAYRTAVAELSNATDEREIRRVLEVVATRTPVLGHGEIPPELDGLVLDATATAEGREALRTMLASDELRDRLAHRAWRTLHREHSLTGRVDGLLRHLGIDAPRPSPSLTMMVPTNRPHQLETVLDNLGRQTYPNLSVLLVLHGVDVDTARLQDLAAARGLDRIDVLRVDASVALGDVFNLGFAACEGDLVGKMDDDDHYGAEYASDLVADFEHADADIVGKWAHYAYSQALDATLLRYAESENTFTDLLAISTLIMKPEVVAQVPFLPMEKGSGSQFLRAAGALGARVYAGNRFNYLYNRYTGDGHSHTWPVAEYEFAARSRFVCQGQNLQAVDA